MSCLKSGEHSNIKADFAIKLTGMIEAGCNTAWVHGTHEEKD